MIRTLAAAVLIGLLGVSAIAQDPKLPGPKIEFPDVMGFKRDKPYVYPQPPLGYSVGYSAPGLVATVYVYDAGLKEIPTGAKAEVIKAQMKQVVADLDAAKKLGHYKSVKEVGKEETVSLGKGKEAPMALKRKFEVDRTKDGEKLSEAYLTGYKNHFVKVRITYDPATKSEAEKQIPTLLEAIGSALK